MSSSYKPSLVPLVIQWAECGCTQHSQTATLRHISTAQHMHSTYITIRFARTLAGGLTWFAHRHRPWRSWNLVCRPIDQYLQPVKSESPARRAAGWANRCWQLPCRSSCLPVHQLLPLLLAQRVHTHTRLQGLCGAAGPAQSLCQYRRVHTGNA